MNIALVKDENIMIFQPKLAGLLGLNEAIVLNQIHYWLGKSKNIIDEKPWVYNTYENWQKQIDFLSTGTIRKTIKKLEDKGIIISKNFNRSKIDKTKWYTIDYEILNNLYEQIGLSEQEEDNSTADNTTYDEINESPVPSDKSIGINAQSTAKNEKWIHLNEQSILKKEQSISLNEQSMRSEEPDHVDNISRTIPETTTEITTTIVTNGREQDKQENNFADTLKKVVNFYADNIRLPGSYELERIKYLCEEFVSPELIILAMQQSIDANARNIRYAEQVLYSWRDRGIKTLKEAQKSVEDYNKYKGGRINGKLAGNYGENRFYNSKTSPENSNKWSGYKPPEPKARYSTDDEDLI